MIARARAHGKVILLGEHACVYGTPALAASLDRGAEAEASRTSEGSTRIATLLLGEDRVEADASSTDDRAHAFAALIDAAPTNGGVHVLASSALMPGGGLGSSAALGVAIGRAVTELARGQADEVEALARADAWERVFHGNPSGIDVAAAARGGCLRFTRAEGCESIAPAKDLVLAIGSTGKGASTRAMVEGVAALRARKHEMVDRAVEAIRTLVDNAALAVRAGDLDALGKLMNLNQMLLAGLLVSTEDIEDLCATARSNDALGAKLTGAGGGGSVIALARTSEGAARIVDAWRARGFDGFVATVHAFTAIAGAPP